MKREFTIEQIVFATPRAVRFMKMLSRRYPHLKVRLKNKLEHIKHHVNNNAALHDIADIKNIGGNRFYVFKIGSIELIAKIDFVNGIMAITDIYFVD